MARRETPVSVLFLVVLLLASCSRDPQKAKQKYFAVGQSYMAKGQYGDAAIEFRHSLQLDPRFVDAYYGLARADLARHDWSAAYSSLEKAIQLDPSRLDARLTEGRLYLAARQFDKAEEQAHYVLNQDSNNVGGYQLLAGALLGERKPNDALKALSTITSLLPHNANALINIALVEISLQNPPEAERYFKQAVAVDPQNNEAIIDLAHFYQLQDRPGDAGETLKGGINQNHKSINLYTNLASLLAYQNRNDEVEPVLKQLRERLPDSTEAEIAIGDFYATNHEADQALAEYKRGLSGSGHLLEIKERMEDLYLADGRLQQAAELDRDLSKAAPKDVTVRVNHARLLLGQGDVEDSIRTLESAVADDADSAAARYFLAMAYEQKQDFGQASSALQDALKIAPNWTPSQQALAKLSLRQGNLAVARNYAEELVNRFPGDADNHRLLADIASRQKEYEVAEAQISAALKLAPNDPTLLLDSAEIFSTEEKSEKAEETFESAFRLDSHNIAILQAWIGFLVKQQHVDRALTLADDYAKHNASADGQVLLATLHLQSREYTAAQADLQRAINLDPQNINAYIQLGKTYKAMGQVDPEVSAYERAFQLEPKSAPLATLVGNAYLDKQNLVTSRKFFTQALEIDPSFAIASANLAWVKALEGEDLDTALGLAQRAQSEMPDVPTITDTLAWVMYKRGEYFSAIPLLEKCVQRSPGSPDFQFHLGMVLSAAGERNRARHFLLAALQNNLDASDAREARRTISQLN